MRSDPQRIEMLDEYAGKEMSISTGFGVSVGTFPHNPSLTPIYWGADGVAHRWSRLRRASREVCSPSALAPAASRLKHNMCFSIVKVVNEYTIDIQHAVTYLPCNQSKSSSTHRTSLSLIPPRMRLLFVARNDSGNKLFLFFVNVIFHCAHVARTVASAPMRGIFLQEFPKVLMMYERILRMCAFEGPASVQRQ